MNISRTYALLGLLAVGLTTPLAYGANRTGVQIETVNNYAPCGIGPQLTNSNSSGSKFAADGAR